MTSQQEESNSQQTYTIDDITISAEQAARLNELYPATLTVERMIEVIDLLKEHRLSEESLLKMQEVPTLDKELFYVVTENNLQTVNENINKFLQNNPANKLVLLDNDDTFVITTPLFSESQLALLYLEFGVNIFDVTVAEKYSLVPAKMSHRSSPMSIMAEDFPGLLRENVSKMSDKAPIKALLLEQFEKQKELLRTKYANDERELEYFAWGKALQLVRDYYFMSIIEKDENFGISDLFLSQLSEVTEEVNKNDGVVHHIMVTTGDWDRTAIILNKLQNDIRKLLAPGDRFGVLTKDQVAGYSRKNGGKRLMWRSLLDTISKKCKSQVACFEDAFQLLVDAMVERGVTGYLLTHWKIYPGNVSQLESKVLKVLVDEDYSPISNPNPPLQTP